MTEATSHAGRQYQRELVLPGMQGWFSVWIAISMNWLKKETPMIMSIKKMHLTNSNSPIHTKTFQKKEKKRIDGTSSIWETASTQNLYYYVILNGARLNAFLWRSSFLGSQLQLFHGQQKPWGGRSGLRFELWKLTKQTACGSLGGKVPVKSWPLRLRENSPLYGRARKSHCSR